MSQHDLVIDNDTRPSVRADITAGLQALGSNSKGNARPSPAYAGQQWTDDNTPSSSVWSWYHYTGSADIKIGELNTTTNNFMPFVNGVALSSAYAPILNAAANSFLANATAGAAQATGVPLVASQLAGRGATGNVAAISLGAGLVMTGATLSVTNSGKLVNYGFAEVSAFTAASGITPIPFDNTVPQSSEGYEWGTLSYTPANASNRLLVRATVYAGESSNVSDGLIQAIFKNSDADALSANSANAVFGGPAAGVLETSHNMVAGTASAIVFKAHVSFTGAATDININGVGGVGLFGGVGKSKIEVWEFTP